MIPSGFYSGCVIRDTGYPGSRIFCNRISHHASLIGFQVSDFDIRISDFYPATHIGQIHIQLFNFLAKLEKQ